MQSDLLLERDFRISKDDLDLRPIWHRLSDRVKAHVLICMLACYLTWHLREAWAPLTLHRRVSARSGRPGRPAERSPSASTKASRHSTASGQPARSSRGLLDHLATLTRQTITISGQPIDRITTPTPAQRQALDLIGALNLHRPRSL